ncbi:MAG: NAD(P)H-hydrate epimerase [Lawsonella clevelandensis]
MTLPQQETDLAANTALSAAIHSADLALDGIVGIGGRGPLREPAATVIDLLDDAHVPIVSVDIPSGIDPTRGYSMIPMSTPSPPLLSGP